MKPNFALSLSFDGIRLLHRANAGWDLVGEVALDVDDLDAALEELRQAGDRLTATPMATKILIPNEQIKYLALDTTQADDGAVEAALDGATPYALKDLRYDYSKGGGRTYVAAVAQETLDEAQSFAAERGFNPVYFTSAPDPFTYNGEPYFGSAPGHSEAERDDEAVTVTGIAAIPSVTVPPPADARDSNDQTGAGAAEHTPEAEVPVFTSRRDDPVEGEDIKPVPTEVEADPVIEETPAEIAEVSDDAATREEPKTEKRSKLSITGLRAVPTPPADQEAPPPPPAQSGAPAVTGISAATLPSGEGAARSPALTARRNPAPAPDPQPRPEPRVAKLHAVDAGPAIPVVANPNPGAAAPAIGTPSPASTAPVMDAGEQDKMTVFGARKAQSGAVRGKPRFLGLILTAILLLFLLAVGALAARNFDTIARWFGFAQTTEIAQDAPEEVITASAPISEPVADTATPQTAQEDTPPPAEALDSNTADADIGDVLTPEEAERIYAATGVWQRAPRIPDDPNNVETLNVGFSPGYSNWDRKLPLGLPPSDTVAKDPVLAQPVNPPPPSAEFAFGPDGFVIATPDGALTPDGIRVIAGRPQQEPPARPGTVAPPQSALDQLAGITPQGGVDLMPDNPNIVVVAGRPRVTPPIRPGTEAPTTTEQATDVEAATPGESTEGLNIVAGRPALEPPARTAPQQEIEVIRVPPAGEDALNIVAGRPSPEPPTRPGDFAAADTTPDTFVLASAPGPQDTRPSARPGDLAAQIASRVPINPVTSATPTPRARPGNLQIPSAAPEAATPEPEPEPDPTPAPTETDTGQLQVGNQITAAIEAAQNRPNPLINVTSAAVATSLRPDSRPRNMSRIVARAREAAAQQQAAAQSAPAVSRPAQPSGRTPTTVAAAATDENAINLRDVNLISVYVSSSGNRALVRLANGRYQRVTVGDRLDGGRVVAIQDGALVYSKRGRNVTLRVGG